MAETNWILPDLKKGRTEPETNLKNLSTPEYKKAWETHLKKNPKDPKAWAKFEKIFGTKYDENNNKLKPDKKRPGFKPDSLRARPQAGEVRANRESVVNFIFEGDITDITKESKLEEKRSGKKLTAHHIRGIAEEGPWVDKIVSLLEAPKGSKNYKKGVQMAETSRRYMRALDLSGKGGTSLQNLDMIRQGALEQNADGKWVVSNPRFTTDSPHYDTHLKQDFHNITADKGTALGPFRTRQTDASWRAGDTGDDIKYEFTSKGVGGQQTIKAIQGLPDADTDAFIYTTKRDKYGPEHRLNQQVDYTGRRINPTQNFYSSWADHIIGTDPGRIQATLDIRKSVAGSGKPDTGTPHFLESRGIPREVLDPKINAKGALRGFARLAGMSNNPLVNISGDFVGTVMDGAAYMADPSAQNLVDLALSGGQTAANLAALGLAAVPIPGARPGAYAIMKAADVAAKAHRAGKKLEKFSSNLAAVERTWNMSREGRNLNLKGRKNSFSPFQRQVIDEVYMPTAQRQQQSRLWRGLDFSSPF